MWKLLKYSLEVVSTRNERENKKMMSTGGTMVCAEGNGDFRKNRRSTFREKSEHQFFKN